MRRADTRTSVLSLKVAVTAAVVASIVAAALVSVDASLRKGGRPPASARDGAAIAIAALVTALATLTVYRRIDALEQANASAEQRSSELDRFAGRVAHDIVSPLTTVRFALDLSRKRIDPRESGLLRAIARATGSLERVQRLVDGLLEFARAGAVPSPGSVSDVTAVVRDVVDGLEAEAEAHRVTLEVGALASGPAACSAGVLTSLVENLVKNAICHMGDSPRRVVQISAQARGDFVRVEVDDTGQGVPERVGEAIFEPFIRGPSARAPGVGLGLATVKLLARAHGGEAGYRSRRGQGSTFWFALPSGADRRTAGPSPRQLA